MISDTEQLFLVLLALYLFDCVRWVERGVLGLRSYVGGRFRATVASRAIGNVRAGLVWNHPLPPLGTLLSAASWPLGVSPDGVCTLERCELDRGARAVFVPRARAWQGIREFARSGCAIEIDGEEFGLATSESEARRFVDWLAHVQALPREQRAAAIDAALAESLTPGRARARADEFETRARVLRTLCCVLFAFLFVGLPWTVEHFGLERTWPWLLGVMLVLHGAILAVFTRVHGRTTPGFASAMAQLALSPPQAVRAVDLASRTVLAGLHPLAALELLPERERAPLRRAVCVDAFHPREPADGSDVLALRCGAQYRELLQRALTTRLALDGTDPARVLTAPELDDPARRSWCPRCELQFDIESAVCGDCSTRAVPRTERAVV